MFDALTDARRFVLCDLEFNLGSRGWLEFSSTRAIVNAAQRADILDATNGITDATVAWLPAAATS